MSLLLSNILSHNLHRSVTFSDYLTRPFHTTFSLIFLPVSLPLSFTISSYLYPYPTPFQPQFLLYLKGSTRLFIYHHGKGLYLLTTFFSPLPPPLFITKDKKLYRSKLRTPSTSVDPYLTLITPLDLIFVLKPLNRRKSLINLGTLTSFSGTSSGSPLGTTSGNRPPTCLLDLSVLFWF